MSSGTRCSAVRQLRRALRRARDLRLREPPSPDPPHAAPSLGAGQTPPLDPGRPDAAGSAPQRDRTPADAPESGRTPADGPTLHAGRPPAPGASPSRPTELAGEPGHDTARDPGLELRAVDPARPTRADVPPVTVAGSPAWSSEPAAPADPTGWAVDLEVLEEEVRAELEAAVFAREVRRRRLLAADVLEQAGGAARAAGVRLETHVVDAGLLSPEAAMAVYATVQQASHVCALCLALLHDAPSRCPECRRPLALHGEGRRRGDRTAAPSPPRPAVALDGPRPAAVLGPYHLLERLGEGGMGVVFKARDERRQRTVALKVLRGGVLADAERRRRFLQEAEAVAALEHPNVVRVHEVGELEAYPYYTMDLLEGPPIDVYAAEQGAAPREVAALVRVVADAVHHFHLRAIIHRDLKPSNVLVDADGVPRVIDFGIAKRLETSNTEATVEGAVLGTLHYMPPEQAGGRVHDVDARTDIYALGALLYRLLGGEPPFAHLRGAAVLEAIEAEDPRPLRELNPAVEAVLDAIVQRAMNKAPARRYQSALSLARDLERYAADEPV